MPLNPSSPVPLYQQFKLLIERKIADGEWPPDSPLPPELTMIETYGISRTTVRQALDELVQEGRIYRQRGKGTYVAPPRFGQTLATLTGFVEELTLRHLNPVVRVITHRAIPAGAEVGRALQMPPDTRVLHISRLVHVADAPLFLDQCYFPLELAGTLTPERVQAEPIYQLLVQGGRSPAEGEQRVGAIPIPADAAAHLGVAPGTPGLAITRISRDQFGIPIEYIAVTYRGDRYHFDITLHR